MCIDFLFVIQRSLATKDLEYIKWVFPRSFASFHSALGDILYYPHTRGRGEGGRYRRKNRDGDVQYLFPKFFLHGVCVLSGCFIRRGLHGLHGFYVLMFP